MLLIDTLPKGSPEAVVAEKVLGERYADLHTIHTDGLEIRPCVGCNFCWLKTPGICVHKDDYVEIFKKMLLAEAVWVLTDTKFGIAGYQTKRLFDRIVPMLTMQLEFRGGYMRHVLRYDACPDFGLIYRGEGDAGLLAEWMERVAMNMDSRSLGVYSVEHLEEGISCIQSS